MHKVKWSIQVDDNEKVRVLAFKSRKDTMTTIDTKLKGGKLLTISIKIALEKDEQDMNVKKI